MKKIAIITDSTSGYVNKQFPDFYVIPLMVNVKQTSKENNGQMTSYHDNIDLNADQMREIMQSKKVEISTSQPILGEIIDLFEEISPQYDDIYVIPLTAFVSGSENTWRLAAEDFSNVHVLSTHMGAPMLKFYVQDFIEASKKGVLTPEWATAYCEKARKTVFGMFVGTDLRYIAKNSRIKGAFLKFLHTLNIKLLVSVDNRGINFFKPVITTKQICKGIRKYFKKQCGESLKPQDIKRIMFIYDKKDEGAKQIQKQVNLFKKDLAKDTEVWYETMTPLMMVYTGLNGLLVAIETKEPSTVYNTKNKK